MEHPITSLPQARRAADREPGQPVAAAALCGLAHASLPVRSAERRRWTADLLGPAVAGLVLQGAGGMGKSTLAAAMTERIALLEPERVPVLLRGEVSADGFLAALGAALRSSPAAAGAGPSVAAVCETVPEAGRPWRDRLAGLREHVLAQVPVLVVLDDFDDNTSAGRGPRTVRDQALAGLLAGWLGDPGLGRLLITCRDRFTLPGAGGALSVRHLGPLSRAAAAELAGSLPACGRLDEAELDLAWRLTGGHPLALKYLDSLLATGVDAFADVARRLSRAIQERTGNPVPLAGPGPLAVPPAAAEAVAVAASDALLGELWDGLSPAAQALLADVSVYRVPVPCSAPLLQAGHDGAGSHERRSPERRSLERRSPDSYGSPDGPDTPECPDKPGRAGRPGGADGEVAGPLAERAPTGPLGAGPARQDGRGGPGGDVAAALAECAAAGLVAIDPAGELGTVFVHRWTAHELHGRLAGPQRAGELRAAHRRAAGYWRRRADGGPADPRALSELRYHLAETARLGRNSRPARGSRTSVGRRWLRVASAVAAFLAVAASGTLAARHLASSTGAGHPEAPGAREATAQAQAAGAAAARGQAAAWVAGQVSRQVTVACDPAMCAALRAHGFPGRLLLVLRPDTAARDRAGLHHGGLPRAGLVVTTATLRGELGTRLADGYAPVVVAGFGTGPRRIEVCAVAAGYRAGLAADVAARRAAGRQLLGNPSVSVTVAARADLAGGRVDSRLLITLATMAVAEPVRVLSFTDSGPGASAGMPLRAAEITVAAPVSAGTSAPARGGTSGPASGSTSAPASGGMSAPASGSTSAPASGGTFAPASAGTSAPASGRTASPGPTGPVSTASPTSPSGGLAYLLAFAWAQRPPYRPARARIVRTAAGPRALSIEFPSPTPFGLLPAPGP